MASPYFSPAPQGRVALNTNFQAGAQAQAQALSSIGENIGGLLREGVSSYMTEKKWKKFAADRASNPDAMVENMYKSKGMPLPADPKEIETDLYEMVKRTGGPERWEDAVQKDFQFAQTMNAAKKAADIQQEQHSVYMANAARVKAEADRSLAHSNALSEIYKGAINSGDPVAYFRDNPISPDSSPAHV